MFSRHNAKTYSLFTHLSLSYLAVYAVCTFVLYFINARVISNSARAFDRQDVQSDSLEYAEILSHDNSGNWLAEEVSIENFPPSTLFAIRILDAHGAIIYSASQPDDFAFPGGWNTLDTPPRPPKEGWQTPYLPAYNRHLQLKTTLLGDGRFLQVAKSTERENIQHLTLRRTSFFFFLLAALFTLINGIWIKAIMLNPIQQIAKEMSAITQHGTFDAHVRPVSSRIAELDTLGRLFNLLLQKNATLITAMRDTLDNLAHDFRTPLARIRSAAEFTLNAKSPPPSREALLNTLADIIEDCDTAHLQLQNLMDIRAMESGVVKLDIRPFDLKATANEIIDLYAVLAEDKNIGLDTELPDGSVPVEGDAPRLSQAIANLLDNAVKYTPCGGHIRIILAQTDGNVILTVADTGIGIPEAEHALIWQRLYRSRNARSEKGLGLGMSIVKTIVESHNGTVTFSSTLGRGSTFVMTLPTRQPNLSQV